MKRYVYLGCKMTDPALKGQPCTAILRTDGKCIRGKNGNFLVRFDSGREAVVIGRLLRKVTVENSVTVQIQFPDVALDWFFYRNGETYQVREEDYLWYVVVDGPCKGMHIRTDHCQKIK